MSEQEAQAARKAYEYFKLMWMQSHGYSLDDLMSQLEKVRRDLYDEDASFQTIYEYWEDEVGFGGEIWPCFDEFVDNEYKVFEAIAKA